MTEEEEKILQRIDESIAALKDSITEAHKLGIEIYLSTESIHMLGSQFRQYNISYDASKKLRVALPSTLYPKVSYSGGQ